eukprot:4735124-Amphidinium_carterae.1
MPFDESVHELPSEYITRCCLCPYRTYVHTELSASMSPCIRCPVNTSPFAAVREEPSASMSPCMCCPVNTSSFAAVREEPSASMSPCIRCPVNTSPFAAVSEEPSASMSPCLHCPVHTSSSRLPYVAHAGDMQELRRSVITHEWRVHRYIERHSAAACAWNNRRGQEENKNKVPGPILEEHGHCELRRGAWSCVYRCLQMLYPMSLRSMLERTGGQDGCLADMVSVAQCFPLAFVCQQMVSHEEHVTCLQTQLCENLLRGPVVVATDDTCRLVLRRCAQTFVVLDPHLPCSRMEYPLSLSELFAYGAQITMLQLEGSELSAVPCTELSSGHLTSHLAGGPNQEANLY